MQRITFVQPATTSIDRYLSWSAIAAVSLLLFFPMLAVAAYLQEPSQSITSGAAEATVGVGVILRAIGRRLFRAGARNVARLTFGTMTRAVSRTAVSRIVKLFVRSAVASEVKGMSDDVKIPAFESTGRAVAVGALGTAMSFWGVGMIATSSGIFTPEIPLFEMAIWAALPLIVIALAASVGRTLFQAVPRFSTGADGLALQTYFTLSGSFLPMTTDISFDGEPRNRSHASTLVLATLVAIFLMLKLIGNDSFRIEFIGTMFLAYAFVYSFPVNPLLGHTIWAHSRWLWAIVFVGILLCFLFLLSESMSSLL